jgi:hypothetical protein
MTELNRRTQGPRNQSEFAREAALMARGKRIPGDDLIDMLNSIEDGEVKEADGSIPTEIIDAGESAVSRGEESQSINPVQLHPTQLHEALPPTSKPINEIPTEIPSIPVEILDVLKSPERQELIEVAQLLRRSQYHSQTMLFVTPLGDIKCTVNWMSCRPHQINPNNMFFVKTRANTLAFIPKPGAEFDIAFEGVKGSVRVVCLAEPLRLYPGVDLLCFMPHTPFVEKTGQLKDGAPSVVSGKPATAVIDDEPVVDGEQPMRKEAFSLNQSTDFDKVRPS